MTRRPAQGILPYQHITRLITDTVCSAFEPGGSARVTGASMNGSRAATPATRPKAKGKAKAGSRR